MKTIEFEGVKVALKQDKTGYVLSLSIHPDDVPMDLLRDFVGARYQVVMVRLDGNEKPMDRQEEFQGERSIKIAAILCKDPQFWAYLYEDAQIMQENETEATEWLKNYLVVGSRSELKTNHEARMLLDKLERSFNSWKTKS
jgi:hypothetical protein